MRGYMKLVSSVALLAVALGSSSVIAAKKVQKVASEEQKSCYAACKSNKDATTYEGCMIKCDQAEKERIRKATGK